MNKRINKRNLTVTQRKKRTAFRTREYVTTINYKLLPSLKKKLQKKNGILKEINSERVLLKKHIRQLENHLARISQAIKSTS